MLRNSRGVEAACDPNILEWEMQVRHPLFSRIRARLVATDTKDQCAGKCSIEVWAEEAFSDEVLELAYCRGMLCPRESRVIVLWLGRSNARNVHPRARGRRSIASGDTEYTVAEALFGLVAAIAQNFKVSIVELQAKDNGSGKLVDLYLRLGFSKRPQPPGEILWMEAPVEHVAQIAPTRFVDGLVPDSFDGRAWMHDVLSKERSILALRSLCQEPHRWNASWPAGARVIVKLTPSYGFGHHGREVTRIQIEASLIDLYDDPLAFASANVRLSNDFCQLRWLGLQKSKPVHKKVSGQRMYKVHPRTCADTGSCEPSDTVTAAMALLGVLAAFAHRLGASRLNLNALDNGSGKLEAYFRKHGFTEPSEGHADSGKGDHQPCLSAPSHEVMQRCLPLEWESQLPGTIAHLAPRPEPSKNNVVQLPSLNINSACDANANARCTSEAKISGRRASRQRQIPKGEATK